MRPYVAVQSGDRRDVNDVAPSIRKAAQGLKDVVPPSRDDLPQGIVLLEALGNEHVEAVLEVGCRWLKALDLECSRQRCEWPMRDRLSAANRSRVGWKHYQGKREIAERGDGGRLLEQPLAILAEVLGNEPAKALQITHDHRTVGMRCRAVALESIEQRESPIGQPWETQPYSIRGTRSMFN